MPFCCYACPTASEFACLLYSMMTVRLAESTVHTIVRDAVDIEKKFICVALSCGLIGMNANLMSVYIEFVADRLLVMLGYAKIWNAANPFEWMEMISLQGKTNFFERRVAEYQKSGVMHAAETHGSDDAFSTDAAF